MGTTVATSAFQESGTGVPSTRTVAGHALSADVVISPADLALEIAPGAVITVAPSGAMYTTVQDAIAYVNSLKIHNGISLTIQIDDGTYANNTPLNITTLNFTNVTITGKNTYSRTLSSIQSSSGSAGAWSIVLNVNSVANIAVNDWVLITNPSGGTLPSYIAGAHKVTNVDAVNTRITVTSKHANATPPSGAVSATVTVMKTILTFSGCDGLQVYGHTTMGNFSNLMMVGNGAGIGLNVQDNGRLWTYPAIGVADFNINVYALYGAQINSDSPLVSTHATSFNLCALDGGIISLGDYSVSSGSLLDGVSANRMGSVYIPNSIVTGNVGDGLGAARYGTVTMTGPLSGNNRGVSTDLFGYINSTGITLSGNTVADSRIYTFPSATVTTLGTSSITLTGTDAPFNFVDGSNTTLVRQHGNTWQIISNQGTIQLNSFAGMDFQVNWTTKWSIDSSGNLVAVEGVSQVFGTTTGTKFGTATTQKMGWWNATPVVQPAAQADASGGATVDAEARTAINGLLAKLRTLGLIAT